MNYTIQPSRMPQPDRIVVIGDVHGDFERLLTCLVAVNVFSPHLEWIAEPKNTIVVQLGDQIDSASRGGDPSWERKADLDVLFMTDKMDRIAAAHGGRFISLIGNHEIMNFMGEYHFVSGKSMDFTGKDIRKSFFVPGTGVCAQMLAKRNVVVQIGKYLFAHGGLLPFHLDILEGDFNNANILIQKVLRGEKINTLEAERINTAVASAEGILWTRSLFNLLPDESVIERIMDSVLQRTNSVSMFVGHNTVQEIRGVANNKLFFVDAGFSRSYPFDRMQILEITKHADRDNVNIIEIQMPT